MSVENLVTNRAVWFDIPVVDLDRATKFYSGVLGVKVEQSTFENFTFAVIEHDNGNGGCLVPNPEAVSDRGILIYLNADGRIRDAVAKTGELGGEIVKDVHPIGPHGFRAIVNDSEGNRLALHSQTDQ